MQSRLKRFVPNVGFRSRTDGFRSSEKIRTVLRRVALRRIFARRNDLIVGHRTLKTVDGVVQIRAFAKDLLGTVRHRGDETVRNARRRNLPFRSHHGQRRFAFQFIVDAFERLLRSQREHSFGMMNLLETFDGDH